MQRGRTEGGEHQRLDRRGRWRTEVRRKELIHIHYRVLKQPPLEDPDRPQAFERNVKTNKQLMNKNRNNVLFNLQSNLLIYYDS